MITQSDQTHLVLVYGTLKVGFHNHHLLEDDEFVSFFKTSARFTMYDLGGCPAITISGSSRIKGEVFRVSKDTLKALDALEGHPDIYKRIQIKTQFGLCWVYTITEDQLGIKKKIVSGHWTR